MGDYTPSVGKEVNQDSLFGASRVGFNRCECGGEEFAASAGQSADEPRGG